MAVPLLLLVEDEPKLATTIQNYLQSEGFRVEVAGDGQAALSLFGEENPALVLLDLSLPVLSGLDVCREIRKVSNTPIVIVTARADEVDKLVGLELGADDYVTKPFSLRELTARIRAVLRRASPASGSGTAAVDGELLTFEGLTVDMGRHEVKVQGASVQLTPTEFKLLSTLARRPGRVYSRLQLLEAALGDSYEGYERSIDTHISNLRRKIEADPANPSHVVTVFGVGYKFTGRAAGPRPRSGV